MVHGPLGSYLPSPMTDMNVHYTCIPTLDNHLGILVSASAYTEGFEMAIFCLVCLIISHRQIEWSHSFVQQCSPKYLLCIDKRSRQFFFNLKVPLFASLCYYFLFLILVLIKFLNSKAYVLKHCRATNFDIYDFLCWQCAHKLEIWNT